MSNRQHTYFFQHYKQEPIVPFIHYIMSIWPTTLAMTRRTHMVQVKRRSVCAELAVELINYYNIHTQSNQISTITLQHIYAV